ncbi:unnamed protein product [Amaranthus hypochondriacus]
MTKKELIFIPSPGMGHLVSAVEFAKHLIEQDQRITIQIIIFHLPVFNISNVETYLDSQLQALNPNQIKFLTLPRLQNPPDPSSKNFYRTVVELQKSLVEMAVLNRQHQEESTPVAAFVLDMLCVTMIDIANKIGVPSFIYFTAGANLLNFMLHYQSIVDDKEDDLLCLFDDCNARLNLPGFRDLVPARVLPLFKLDKDSEWRTLTVEMARRFRETKGILVNTFYELNPFAIEASVKNDFIVYPVGPILALDHNKDGSQEKDHHHQHQSSIMMWLDEQPSSSVVFLCFGSMGSFDEEQVKEIANGLERSGYRFLWSLRKPPEKGKFGAPSEDEIFHDALPDGFMDRVGNRGKLIGWAPQASILSNRGIGGFVSHCGWNSILESIWFGVPIATWPVYSEQQLNAFELINELGLSVEIKMDYKRDMRMNKANYVVTAKEVENGVKNLMGMDNEMRFKVREMKNKSRRALEHGGSSFDSLNRFVGHFFE